MIRQASVSATLMLGLAAAAPAEADPQGFEGRPHGGSSAGDLLLHRHGMTAEQYDKMREKPEPLPTKKER